jgi:hypothetical protein
LKKCTANDVVGNMKEHKKITNSRKERICLIFI